MWSNCCGSEPSYLSDELCGSCLEHAVFDDEDEELTKVVINSLLWQEIQNILTGGYTYKSTMTYTMKFTFGGFG